jgi:hypothetical protein
MVLSTLLMLGILGTMGYLFNLPACISKIVRTSAGEELELKVEASMRPSFWQYLGDQFTAAWRVGTTQKSTVNIRFTITVTGTNIANTATAYFYVEARDSSGSPTYRELDYSSGTSITVGSATTFETGSMTIDTHLSHIYGSAPTVDKTVDYYLWCKVEVTGLISGQKLTAELPVQKFDSALYDYGVTKSSSTTLYVSKDTQVLSDYPDTNYGTGTSASFGLSTSKQAWTLIAFDLSALPDTMSPTSMSLSMDCTGAYSSYPSGYTGRIYRLTDNSWGETTVTWNTKPPYDSSKYVSFSLSTDVSVDYNNINVLSLWDPSCAGKSIGFVIMVVAPTPDANYYGSSIRTKEGSTTTCARLAIAYNYIDWSASWSWLNLDTLSISSLKVTQELAPLILVFVSAICIMLLLRRR